MSKNTSDSRQITKEDTAKDEHTKVNEGSKTYEINLEDNHKLDSNLLKSNNFPTNSVELMNTIELMNSLTPPQNSIHVQGGQYPSLMELNHMYPQASS